MKLSKIATLQNIALAALAIIAVWLLFFSFEDSSAKPRAQYANAKRAEQSLPKERANQDKSSDEETPASAASTDERDDAPDDAKVEKSPAKKESDAGTPSLSERITSLPSAVKSAVQFKLGDFMPNAEIDTPIRGDVRVEIIDDRTICVVGYYHKFLKDRFLKECGDFMRGIDSPAANLASWSRNVFYNILGAQIILKYRPVIASAYQSDFKISNGATISERGYWLNPLGQGRFPEVYTGEDRLTHNAEVAHFAYLKLAAPLEDGKVYEVENALGESVKFSYSARENLSGAIKVNQLGYSPEAGRKYAYVGAWLGSLGALDYSARLEGKSFSIRKKDGGEKVFEAPLKRAVPDAKYKSGAQFTGEVVYEADFSNFNQKGAYFLFVEGIGKSHDFEISDNAIGEAFYIHSKGLYHKRCGIDKAKPHTNWTMGKCHMVTYQSDFPPNNRDYTASKKNSDQGFFDAAGKSISVSHFRLIGLRANKLVAKDVHGGWHDAADYDRRPYHFDVVCDLIAPYIYRPQNFDDNQLNIPESGNGIPDILDEAVWGMKVWLAAQQKNGAVGTWIEATSHPKNYNPSTDEQPYYLSAATRESTMQYAAHASMLALALRESGADALAKTYEDSALRAYDFAINPENRFVKTYQYPSDTRQEESSMRPITYKESKDVPAEYTFKTAFNLWLLTKDAKYLRECKRLELAMPQKFIETSWKINPFFFAEFLKYGKGVAELEQTYKALKKRVEMYADDRLAMLENYPYRIPWYESSHPYVTHMSWGTYHPLRNAKFFVNAYEMTHEQRYRDAAFICNDFHNGANPNGQTMTAGLGKNYPVQFLDLASYADGIDEFVQGITPYRNTFGIAREDATLAHALIYKPRADRKFFPKPTMLMPTSVIGDEPLTTTELVTKLGQAWPVWHRFANVEAYSVAASEFTVSETIAPAVSVTGWLLSEKWQPSEKLKNIEPSADRTKLKGFAPLP